MSANARADGDSASQRRTAQPTERGRRAGRGTSRRSPPPGTARPGNAGTTARPSPSSASSSAVSQSATLVSKANLTPNSAQAASRWAAEVEFGGGG